LGNPAIFVILEETRGFPPPARAWVWLYQQ
jgi:hypothetical protein